MAKFTNPRDRGELTDTPEPETVPIASQIDIAAIVQAAVTAALAAGKQDSHELADAITKGMQQVAAPIHENKVSDGVSELNPLGDTKHPRPGLKCEVWYGAYEASDNPADVRVKKAWEVYDHDCSAWEQLALNMLEPMAKTIKRLDRQDMHVIVTGVRSQTSGELQRLVIGLPLSVIGKGSDAAGRNMVPDITDLVRQLTGHDLTPERVPYDKTAKDGGTLGRLMAAHRAKNYVAVDPASETVAA